ncbi:MAG: hypothetical protein GX444_16110 [Myxococcales bacterium]|nr:hypothetical protein [Myxococcales bacterium]
MLPQVKLGELLMQRGLITAEQLHTGLAKQEKLGCRIGSILVKLGYINEETLLHFLSMYYDVPQVDLRYTEIHPNAVRMLDAEIAQFYMVLPIRFMERPPDEPVLIVATPDPTNVDAIDKVRQVTGCMVEPYVCSFGMFEVYFEEAYRDYVNPQNLANLIAVTDPEILIKALTAILVGKKVITCTDLKGAIAEIEKE